MIYPIPKPSAAVGPNPNRRNAGFPQFEVDKIDVPNSAQPGSVNMAGRRVGLYPVSGSKGTGSGADTPCFSLLWFCKCRWMRQYIA